MKGPTAGRRSARAFLALSVAAALGGCAATQYQLKLMPRDSGQIHEGVAEDAGGGEGPITITIGARTYAGTWVEVVPDRTTGYVSGAYGYGRGHAWGLGGTVWVDNPAGGQAKALLRAADGAGLRCDLRGGGRAGGGVCRDDKGLEYDVQIRPAAPK